MKKKAIAKKKGSRATGTAASAARAGNAKKRPVGMQRGGRVPAQGTAGRTTGTTAAAARAGNATGRAAGSRATGTAAAAAGKARRPAMKKGGRVKKK